MTEPGQPKYCHFLPFAGQFSIFHGSSSTKPSAFSLWDNLFPTRSQGWRGTFSPTGSLMYSARAEGGGGFLPSWAGFYVNHLVVASSDSGSFVLPLIYEL